EPMEPLDVVVLGAGPAGSAAANVLGQAGKRVLLLDKSSFPRDKTCGDGMTYKCTDPLVRLGIYDRFLEKARMRALGYSLWFSDGSEVMVKKPAQGTKAFVYVLPRWDFDQIVLDGALRHPTVTFRPHSAARELIYEGGRITGVRVDHEEGSAVYSA